MFEITASRQFTPWLAEQHLSLVFTTYQAGKVFFIGLNPTTGKFSVFERTFDRCMGLCATGNTLYMSSLYQLWRLENSLEPGQTYNGYDALYVPQMSYITGDLDIHDVAVSGDGETGRRGDDVGAKHLGDKSQVTPEVKNPNASPFPNSIVEKHLGDKSQVTPEVKNPNASPFLNSIVEKHLGDNSQVTPEVKNPNASPFPNSIVEKHLGDNSQTTPKVNNPNASPFSNPQPIFINTLFSCLATVSPTHSFVPLWQPPFISKLAAEDRCHLNGLAMVECQPKYVTSISQSDVADGWRDKRRDGGCLIDIDSNEIVVSGLSMPHSPRWYRGKLWLINSGTGEFGTVDPKSGTFEPVAFCPGYGRGLAMYGDYAVVGLSKPRHNKTFQGLPLDENLAQKQAEPRCGLAIIDLRSGDLVHSLRIEGIVEELYDVAILPQVRRSMAIGLKSDEIRRMVSVGTKE